MAVNLSIIARVGDAMLVVLVPSIKSETLGDCWTNAGKAGCEEQTEQRHARNGVRVKSYGQPRQLGFGVTHP